MIGAGNCDTGISAGCCDSRQMDMQAYPLGSLHAQIISSMQWASGRTQRTPSLGGV